MKQRITEYLDYRDYLVDFYDDKREECDYFSYRFISGKVNIDSSHISKILSKKRHMPDRAVNAFVELCGLKKREAECFRLLVKFNKAKTDKEAKQWYECLLSLKDVDSSKLEKEQYEFFNKWYYLAILVLLDFCEFDGDYKWLSKKVTPAITVSEAKNAIELLLVLGLLKKDEKGFFRPTNQFMTTGDTLREMAIKNYQQETIKMASESLFRHKKQDRDISTVTMSMARGTMPTVVEKIRDFRQDLIKYCDDTKDHDSVYQLNVQMYPMTRGGKS